MRRRNFLRTGGAFLGLAARATAGERGTDPARLAFRLKETAGLRRFGYPVSSILPENAGIGPFRLIRNGQEVSAQFRPAPQPDGRIRIVLDFNASPGPLETQEYLVRSGGREDAEQPRIERLRETVNGDSIEVENSSFIRYTMARDLGRFLRAVRAGDQEFLSPGPGGLFVVVGGKKLPLGARSGDEKGNGIGRIDRRGPFAIAFRSLDKHRIRDKSPLDSSLLMVFPSSKTWIDTTWILDDPENQVEAMGVELSMRLEGGPALIDCGAGSTVYTTLAGKERMVFEAGRLPGQGVRTSTWAIRKGAGEQLEPEAISTGSTPDPPEGWVHVMDGTRCTAMAVAGFGTYDRGAIDRFEIEAGGLLRFVRRFPEGTEQSVRATREKVLHFWLHFVPMPVQVGAKTSPQAMLAPLEVAWEPAG